MVTEQLPDAEGDILRRCDRWWARGAVMATLDLYANISPAMVWSSPMR